MMLHRSRPRPVSGGMAVAFGAALAVLLLVALFPLFPRQFNIRVGDTAARTIKSPRDITFESAYLTQQKRDEAARAVPPSLTYDPSVRDRQLAEYDRVTGEATQIRVQTDPARKREALAALQLSERSINTALAVSDERWAAIRAEGRRVLAAELGVSLDTGSVASAKDGVDARIAPDFTADEAFLTGELVRPLIVGTLVEDTARTEQIRAAARAAVSPERVSLNKGDTILAADSRVDEVAIEKLQATHLVTKRVAWRNVVAAALLSILAAVAVAGYVYVARPRGITSERHLLALALITALPVLVAKLYLPIVLPDESRHFLPYLLPVATAPLLIAALLETDVAVVAGAVLGVLIALVSAFLPDVSLVASVSVLDMFRLLAVYSLAPLAGVYVVHRADRLNRYVTAGLAIAAASYLMLLAAWFIDSDRQAADLGWIAFATGVSGISAGVLAAGAFVSTGVLFGVTTRVQLMELSQLNAPLLRRLQDVAPGTFHHSIIVGNLAERAADLVDADPLLTRVGCYYHDIGKTLQPGMYIENQLSGEAPHEDMPPEESAAIIRHHVLGGLELARHEGLPPRVQAFIPEHHGTRLVAYFYRKAAEADPGVDPAAFQYPGPRPQSKETAIVMLADSTEALVRSSPDRSPARIEAMVEEVIAERVAEGQLDDSDLTLRDLRTIAESFKATMRGVYHPRVQYPAPTPMETRRRVLRLPLRPAAGERPEPGLPRRRPRKYEL